MTRADNIRAMAAMALLGGGALVTTTEATETRPPPMTLKQLERFSNMSVGMKQAADKRARKRAKRGVL
jgi:hypothetical protein